MNFFSLSPAASILAKCLLLIGAGWSLGCDNQAAAQESKASGPPPAHVVVEQLESKSFVERRIFYGQVSAASDASLSPAESGLVTQVHVVEGQKVKRGTVLVELDDRLARVELSEAVAQKKQTTAQEQQARFESARFEALRNEQIVSELEAARKVTDAESLSAQAESNQARIALGAELVRRHRIEAPFDGIVTRRMVDPGDWLNSGEVALQMLTAGHVEVDVRVGTEMLDAVDRVARVLLVRDGARQDKGRALALNEVGELKEQSTVVSGRIDTVVDALDPETRTALFRITPEGPPPPWLRPGTTVDVVFFVERSDGLTIPRDALVYGVAGQRVLVVEAGLARPINVEVVAQSRELALVRAEELSLGAALVTRGNERLRPGQAVTTEGALVPPTVPEKNEPRPPTSRSGGDE